MTDDDDSIKSEYLREVFDPKELPKTIEYAERSIARFAKTTPFDTIAFMGVSGAALAFSLSVRLQKSLLCVRKKEARAHSKLDIEGNHASKRYIIVDDFIDSGRTIDRIRSRISAKIDQIELVGIYLYRPFKSGTECWTREDENDLIPIIPEKVVEAEPNLLLPHD